MGQVEVIFGIFGSSAMHIYQHSLGRQPFRLMIQILMNWWQLL